MRHLKRALWGLMIIVFALLLVLPVGLFLVTLGVVLYVVRITGMIFSFDKSMPDEAPFFPRPSKNDHIRLGWYMKEVFEAIENFN